LTPAALANRTSRAASARADRLNEAQPARQRNQPVVPQAGHDDHVGLGCEPVEFVALAHFEAADAGTQRVEACLHLIRRVREADYELVLGRDHAVVALLRLGPQQ
jgi:hypothetical protein